MSRMPSRHKDAPMRATGQLLPCGVIWASPSKSSSQPPSAAASKERTAESPKVWAIGPPPSPPQGSRGGPHRRRPSSDREQDNSRSPRRPERSGAKHRTSSPTTDFSATTCLWSPTQSCQLQPLPELCVLQSRPAQRCIWAQANRLS